MFSIRLIIILFLLPLLLTSCTNAPYMGRLALGEAKILGGSVPYQEIIEDKGIDENKKEGIRLVQEVKEFSQKKLGLRLDGSYETFYQVRGDALIYLVSACPKDSMKPYTWRFPVVGEVEYKGFFDRQDAVKEIKKLEEKGMDTCLQHVIAFSTLGWLRDPIYSTVLDCHPVVIINIIIHELVHNTFYFKRETEFNEQIASFIAGKGSLMFIEERFGLRSPSYQRALDFSGDEAIMAGFFQGLYGVLKGFYTQDLTREEKISMREEIFAQGQRGLTELSKTLTTGDPSDHIGRLNNAVILAYRRYLLSSESLLQQAYAALGGDVKSLIELLFTIKKSKEPPYRFLERWLQERATPHSG